MNILNALGLGQAMGGIEHTLRRIKINIEHIIEAKLRQLRRRMMRYAASAALLIIGLAFLAGGIVLFLSRYFALDLVLIIGGIIVLYIVVLLNISKG